MDIRNSLDGMKSLLGVDSATSATSRPAHSQRIDTDALGSDRATLSSAGSEVSQAAREDGVRTEKVASVRAALAAGTYSVPESAVAAKVVDAMLGGRK